MGFDVRPMELPDFSQLAEIEKEAFPTSWPPTPFRQEYQNRLARYLVACEGELTQLPLEALGAPADEGSPMARLLRGVKGLFSKDDPPVQDPRKLVGFIGIWFMVDEAHVTSIAVRESYRGRGLGEVVLIAGIELAMARGSKEVTLETRVSNNVAQALYEKYGFRRVGIRKGYYTDNREDALIMTTEVLSSPSYQERFRQLCQAHEKRWGRSARDLGTGEAS